MVANVASDDEGNINIDDLAQFILTSGLAEQLGISPEDLNDDANSNLNIEAELLQYPPQVAFGKPLIGPMVRILNCLRHHELTKSTIV